ncbi:hypothetical protein DDI_3241 [Dickeya dianthicola RNS04.9]|nr:hypothetical protein DDI_3241 [Dickeya dianthicola RNS04.9]
MPAAENNRRIPGWLIKHLIIFKRIYKINCWILWRDCSILN